MGKKEEVRVNKPIFVIADPKHPKVLKLESSGAAAPITQWSNYPGAELDQEVAPPGVATELPAQAAPKSVVPAMQEIGRAMSPTFRRWVAPPTPEEAAYIMQELQKLDNQR